MHVQKFIMLTESDDAENNTVVAIITCSTGICYGWSS